MVREFNAVCPKCLQNNKINIVLSWNSAFGEMPVFENRCKDCREPLFYKDVVDDVYKTRKYKIRLNRS